jgi:predicted nucleotide-binding protein
MTAEDLTREDEVRVRENVMHEIGYFQARYGRNRVALLHQDAANVPSNLSGVVYLPFEGENVKSCFSELQKELRRAFVEDRG